MQEGEYRDLSTWWENIQSQYKMWDAYAMEILQSSLENIGCHPQASPTSMGKKNVLHPSVNGECGEESSMMSKEHNLTERNRINQHKIKLAETKTDHVKLEMD